MVRIRVAKDFSDSVGGRYRDEGEYSGQEFREDLLKPKLEEALANKEKLIIDFDGGYGYPTSFLEEAFGGLVRSGLNKDLISRTLELKSVDNPKIINRVLNYIEEAKNNEK